MATWFDLTDRKNTNDRGDFLDRKAFRTRVNFPKLQFPRHLTAHAPSSSLQLLGMVNKVCWTVSLVPFSRVTLELLAVIAQARLTHRQSGLLVPYSDQKFRKPEKTICYLLEAMGKLDREQVNKCQRCNSASPIIWMKTESNYFKFFPY